MEVVPKTAPRRGSDAKNPGRELDPAKGVCSVGAARKSSLSVLSCIGKRTREFDQDVEDQYSINEHLNVK